MGFGAPRRRPAAADPRLVIIGREARHATDVGLLVFTERIGWGARCR